MRARFALAQAQIQCTLREVDLKNKPPALLTASPKATVPVLVLADGRVIDESLDILTFASGQNAHTPLTVHCDNHFTPLLRKYKYFERHPESSQQQYREACEASLMAQLEQQLCEQPYLSGNQIGVQDIALFPHIRQFSLVDAEWFEQSQYPRIRAWLNAFTTYPIFDIIMQKYTPWQEGDKPVMLLSC